MDQSSVVDVVLVQIWAGRILIRIGEKNQFWTVFGGEHVRESLMNLLRYTPLYADRGRVAIITLIDTLTSLRHHVGRGWGWWEDIYYVQTGLPATPEGLSCERLMLRDNPKRLLAYLKQGWTAFQKQLDVINCNDGVEIDAMVDDIICVFQDAICVATVPSCCLARPHCTSCGWGSGSRGG